MRINRFYIERAAEGRAALDAAESHHLIHVLRHRAGDTVEVFDGAGGLAEAVVVEIRRAEAVLDVGPTRRSEPRTRGRIVIAASMAKGSRFDDVVTKCTELGVEGIVPVVYEHTVKQAANPKVRERLFRLAVTAAKQSRNLYLPEVTGPMSLSEAIDHVQKYGTGVRMLMGESGPEAKSSDDIDMDAAVTAAFIGPEAGMTDAETQMLRARGTEAVRLTDTILRVETAAISFAAVLAAKRT